jgi:hypothetical protein
VSRVRITENARITYVWIMTSALTVVSWGLATGHHSSSIPVSLVVLAIGAVKARFIIQQFMDVRTAPRWLRRSTDLWLGTLWAAFVAMYLY